MNPIAEVRPSPIAGTWYSGQPRVLHSEVSDWLDQALLPQLEGEVLGVIAPHAGYRYSGATAGFAFAAVRGQSPQVVAIASPYHQPTASDFLTSAHAWYGTPLGNIALDRDALEAFAQRMDEAGLRLARLANDREHSLEIELPFLQTALAEPFSLLPLMVRSRSVKECEQAGKALAGALEGKRTLLVGSTDLSHFYPLETARQLDAEMLARIQAFDPPAILAAEREGKGYACGAGAIAAILYAAREQGANRVELLHHSTSAEATGDSSSVVGYGAAAILRVK